jgi:hypothetical protein
MYICIPQSHVDCSRYTGWKPDKSCFCFRLLKKSFCCTNYRKWLRVPQIFSVMDTAGYLPGAERPGRKSDLSSQFCILVHNELIRTSIPTCALMSGRGPSLPLPYLLRYYRYHIELSPKLQPKILSRPANTILFLK